LLAVIPNKFKALYNGGGRELLLTSEEEEEDEEKRKLERNSITVFLALFLYAL
jgi:hypothetical protein